MSNGLGTTRQAVRGDRGRWTNEVWAPLDEFGISGGVKVSLR